ncbi:MAG: hypothetical protein PHC69_09665 [Ruminiclostridium sp.]|nr:hypothetical protein [Ruminiclostridium sp.]
MDWWNKLTGLQQIFLTVASPATIILIIQFILLFLGLSNESGADDAFETDDLDLDFDADDLDIGADGLDLDVDDVDLGNTNLDFSRAGTGTTIDTDTGAVADTAIDTDSDSEDGNVTGTLRLFTLRGLIAFFSVGGWTGIFAIDQGAPPPLSIFLAFAAGFAAMYFVAWSVRLILRMQHSGNIRHENAVGKDGEVYLTIPDNGIGKVNVIVQDRLCEMNATARAGRDIKTGEKIVVIGVVSGGLLLVTPYTSPDGVDIKKFEEVS